MRLLSEVTDVRTRPVAGDTTGYVVTGAATMAQTVLSLLSRSGVVAADVQLDRSNLDDAFLALTASGARRDNGQDHAMTALLALTRDELRLLAREPLALFWGIGFPVVLLVVFGLIPGFREAIPELGGSTLLAVYLPVIVVLSMSFLSVTGLPTVVATYRERLILKRLATTPVGAPRLLGAQALQSVVVTLAMAAALLAVGRLAFGVPCPPSCSAGWWRCCCWRPRCSRSACSSRRSRPPARWPMRSAPSCSSR